jgi:succinyl-CoA synthetase beta subunit
VYCICQFSWIQHRRGTWTAHQRWTHVAILSKISLAFVSVPVSPVMKAYSKEATHYGISIQSAAVNPELIFVERLDITKCLPYGTAHRMASNFFAPRTKVLDNFINMQVALFSLFKRYDCVQVEINSLVENRKGEVVACNVRMIVDDNAAFRQNVIFFATGNRSNRFS